MVDFTGKDIMIVVDSDWQSHCECWKPIGTLRGKVKGEDGESTKRNVHRVVNVPMCTCIFLRIQKLIHVQTNRHLIQASSMALKVTISITLVMDQPKTCKTNNIPYQTQLFFVLRANAWIYNISLIRRLSSDLL